MLASDLTTMETARRLGLSWHTVRTHLRNMHQKTGTHSIQGLIGWTAQHARWCMDRVSSSQQS
ncbi:MAG: hypothetical protein Kow0010_21060 [Dehalococcoidia bacterium]